MRVAALQGTLQKFVDDAFQAILSVNRPVPIAVRYLFDFLDELAERHGIEDPETLHIWKTNRCFSGRPRPRINSTWSSRETGTGLGHGQQGRARSPGRRHSPRVPSAAWTRGTAPHAPRCWGPGCGRASRPRPARVPSLLLRFWVNTLKNPQLIFDVRVSDNVDAVLAVIAQTFIDSCTVSEHKVGRVRARGKPLGLGAGPWLGLGVAGAPPRPHSRPPRPEQDSPVNKLLYAREIPRYKQMVER